MIITEKLEVNHKVISYARYGNEWKDIVLETLHNNGFILETEKGGMRYEE